MVEFKDLLNKKIIAFRGLRYKKRPIKLEYVLFDDKKTILEFDEQDYYTYHDCSSMARHIRVRSDKRLWKMMYDKDGYDEPEDLGLCPW